MESSCATSDPGPQTREKPPSIWRSHGLFALVLAFFFVSGACGLAYQVVWTRKLVLLFGTTSYAVSTVLSIFFAGLGAGSLWGGRLADRHPRPLALYGLFEIVIGLWAVVFITSVTWGEGLVVGLLRILPESRALGIGLRGLLALAFLLIPVFLMGATLPLLGRFVARESRLRGFRIGSLYSINTFGAVAGCACTGFFLLPALGYTRTTLAAVAANTAIGLAALIVQRFVSAKAEDSAEPDTSTPVSPSEAQGKESPSWGVHVAVLIVFALSGACALALECLWTRLLAIIFLGTTYAFTTMLTSLLCGIAAGSALAAATIDRFKRSVYLFGLVEILIGAACLAMLPVFASLPEWLQNLQRDAGYEWGQLVRIKFALSFAVLFVPTFLSGMTFPIVIKAFTSRPGHLGREIGGLYSANTLGGLIGALAGGFVLIPLLGTHRGIVALALTLIAAGIALALLAPRAGRLLKAATALGAVGLAAGAMAFAPADVSRALNRGYIPEGDQVLHYREGVEGTVVVSEPRENPSGSDRTLWINAVQATVSIEKGIKMNRFQGVLPLLFDRDPKRVLFMCFGSGITAGTLGLYDFDRIDAVEISGDVLEAAHLFAKDNFDVINNPKVHFIVDDGRNYLLRSEEQYDVITFEPMPLALAGVSTFYTHEYYQLCLDHLTPGGLVSQWVPLHSLSPDLVRSLVFTFTEVFPEYCMWFVNADLFLVGSNEPLHVDLEHAQKRLAIPVIREALSEVGMGDVAEVLSCFFASQPHVQAFAAGGNVMSDDRPWAEFIAPKLIYQRTVDESLAELAPFLESPTVMLRSGSGGEASPLAQQLDRRCAARKEDLEGLRLYYGGTFSSAPEKHFKKALEIDPGDLTAQYYLEEITVARVKTFLDWDEPAKARECLEDALRHMPNNAELLRLREEIPAS